jgi:voltage-gated potassium channel
MAGSVEALERFERQTAWPMLVLSLLIIPLLVIPLIVDLSDGMEGVFFAVDWFVWAAFALEYGIRLYLAPEKGRFVRGNIVDLIVVFVPFLRPLRIARSTRLVRLLRIGRVGVFLLRGASAVRTVLTKRKLNYTLLTAGIVMVGAAFWVLELEREAEDSTIETLPDALWWAITTITTVGYGDTYPTTAGGRAVGAVLMVLGIALFGLVAATLSAFFVERDQAEDPDPQVFTGSG